MNHCAIAMNAMMLIHLSVCDHTVHVSLDLSFFG